MSANTETTGADRTKCKAWCGLPGVKAIAVCGDDGWFMHDADVGRVDTPRFCTPACRDARLPPIAAPAAHVERRKGQRWRMRNVKLGADFSGVLAEDTGATWKLSDVVAMDGKGTDRRFRADMWATPDTTMTLIADAPPEPATVRCAPHGAVASLCIQCKALGKSPPVQEAPKAAPVCTNGRDCKTPIAHVFERVLRDERQLMCDFCYLDYEFNLSKMTSGESTGTPYAGPERLPRPQLAADWVEDCIPTVWR